jgi:hypothetical protein
MNKQLLSILVLMFALGTYKGSACSVAGTATANRDSLCYQDTVLLVTTGYTGTTFQWQSNNGSGWVNETQPGATTDSYLIVPGETKQFRIIVTATGCPSDTSNIVNVTVGSIPVPSGTGASRCGYGQLTLSGSGSANGSLRWYTSPAGGVPIGTGSSVNVTVGSTTTFYLEDNTYSGGGGASPLLITEFDINDYPSGSTGDDLEIQNVSSLPLDVTGWKVAISNSYTDINLVNPNVQTLNGILPPGGILSWGDVTTATNYWGSNILWNSGAYPTFTGWAIILDNNNVVRDFVALNWPAANIAAMAPVINGVQVTIPSSLWAGDGVDITTVVFPQGVARIGNLDNNTKSDFAIQNLDINFTNANLVLPFQGFGCSSPRIPVVATVNPSTAITINSSGSSLCLGQSATLTVSSTNSNYSYTWFPATGLNTTSGNSVTATPLVPTTYYAVGVDGSCGAIDSVFINVGPTSVSGTATVTASTVCAGTSTTLNLSGYTGSIQWQVNTGSGWNNISGANTPAYPFAPTITADYRAEVISGGCPSAISNIINIVVVPVTTPTTTNDTICAGATATLQSTGTGIVNWYNNSNGDTLVHSGNTYNVALNNTTTFYVQTIDGGTVYHVGPADRGIGSQANNASNNFGMRFNVIQEATIDSVYIYPVSAGTVTINLVDSAGTTIINSKTISVPNTFNIYPVYLGFSVTAGNAYRLLVASGSVNLYYNTSGAVYPYTASGCPVSITGYFNPNANTGAAYYYLYNWVVTSGCKSGFIPVTGVVVGPPVPTITPSGSLLTASTAANYQWLLNGNPIPGANSQTYQTTQPGSYTVQVTDPVTGCVVTSQPYLIVSFFDPQLEEAGVSIYPNPSSSNFYLRFNEMFKGNAMVKLFNPIGQLIYQIEISSATGKTIPLEQQLSKGYYILQVTSSEGSYQTKLIKE